MTHTPEDVHGWVAAMRKEVALEPPTPGTIKTPDSIVFDLEIVDAQAAKAIWVVKEADKLREDAAEALLKARAVALGTAEGKNADAREAALTLATEAERTAATAAGVAYRYARGLADLLESRKSSLQTQTKLVLATYQLAGRGRN